MAPCDQGYLCDVCGEEVASIRNSDLYLRFVTGQVASQELLATPERHLACNPTVAQFIEAEAFESVSVTGPFSRDELDEQYVKDQIALMTRGWQRLQELAALESPLPIAEYPLPEFR